MCGCGYLYTFINISCVYFKWTIILRELLSNDVSKLKYYNKYKATTVKSIHQGLFGPNLQLSDGSESLLKGKGLWRWRWGCQGGIDCHAHPRRVAMRRPPLSRQECLQYTVRSRFPDGNAVLTVTVQFYFRNKIENY